MPSYRLPPLRLVCLQALPPSSLPHQWWLHSSSQALLSPSSLQCLTLLSPSPPYTPPFITCNSLPPFLLLSPPSFVQPRLPVSSLTSSLQSNVPGPPPPPPQADLSLTHLLALLPLSPPSVTVTAEREPECCSGRVPSHCDSESHWQLSRCATVSPGLRLTARLARGRELDFPLAGGLGPALPQCQCRPSLSLRPPRRGLRNPACQ